MATTVETRTASESFGLAPVTLGQSSSEAPAAFVSEEPTQKLDKGATLRIASVGFAFFVAGFNDGGIGALIPYILDDYHIDTNIVSIVYGAGFLGWFLVALTQTHLGQHYDMGLMFVFGAFLQIVCQALRAWKPPFALFAVSFFFASAGQALQDTQGNTYVAGVPSSHRWLGVIHGMYAGGCLLGPFVATAIASASVPSKWPLFYLVPLALGVANMGLVVIAFWERLQLVQKPVTDQPVPAEDVDAASSASQLIRATLRTPSVWLLSLFYFFYLGAVLTAGSWVVEYLVVVRNGDLAKMGYVPAGFQGGTLLGRLLLVEPIHRWGERCMVFLFCILSIGLQLLFWLVPNIIAASVAISLFGFFTGVFFPVGMSVATKLFPRKIRSTAMGFLFVISQLGGALFPIITGVAASSSGVSVLQPILVSLISAAAVTWLLVPKPKMTGNDSLHEE